MTDETGCRIGSLVVLLGAALYAGTPDIVQDSRAADDVRLNPVVLRIPAVESARVQRDVMSQAQATMG